MIHSLTILLIGTLGGFCSSTPLGPINIWLTDLSLSNKTGKIVPFLSGVVFSDVAFAWLATWGYSKTLQDSMPNFWLGLISGLFLMGLGAFQLYSLHTKPATCAIKAPSLGGPIAPTKEFILGAAMCASNPGFLLFWVFVVDQSSRYLPLGFSIIDSLWLSLGIILGDVAWFRGLIYLVKKGQEKISQHIVFKTRVGIALLFIIAGLLAGIQTIKIT